MRRSALDVQRPFGGQINDPQVERLQGSSCRVAGQRHSRSSPINCAIRPTFVYDEANRSIRKDATVGTASERQVRVPEAVYATALRHSERLGREIRLDPPEWQGTSSSWFMRSAFDDGNVDLALRFARYERAEYRRLAETVLGGWLRDLCEVVCDADWSGSEPEVLLRMVREQLGPRLEALADLALEGLVTAIDAGDGDWLESAYRQMREVQICSNDLSVRFIQDVLDAIGNQRGDEAVVEALDVSYQRIWKARYETWAALTGHERLALSCEGMRTHYAGPGRTGDFSIVDLGDSYEMSFDPCGTGQVMRRGDDPREPVVYLADPGRGRVRTPAAWNQETVGMPHYCAHCPVLLEHFPLRDLGHILRPVLFDLDPNRPCRWLVPKR
jgi:hypothetical protein